MPSGSYLAINHPTLEVTGEKMATAIRYWNQYGKPPGTHRTPDELTRFFDGMDLVEPGMVSITRWRPDATSSGEPEEIDQFGAVGRKPLCATTTPSTHGNQPRRPPKPLNTP